MEPETTPVEGSEVINTPEATPAPVASTPEGQGNGGEATPAPTDDPILTIAQKKGWDPTQAPSLIAKSYTELESKLGNWKEVESRAKLYESARQKAEMWDKAQEYLQTVGADGNPDISKLPPETLAKLWQSGQVSLADMPADKQFLVQSYVNSMQAAQNQALTDQATTLAQSEPLFTDPEVGELFTEMVATRIESGVDPQQAISQVKSLMQNGERRAEKRLKANVQTIKNGNLEAGGSPAATTPHVKIKSVRDAFNAAKAEMGQR